MTLATLLFDGKTLPPSKEKTIPTLWVENNGLLSKEIKITETERLKSEQENGEQSGVKINSAFFSVVFSPLNSDV